MLDPVKELVLRTRELLFVVVVVLEQPVILFKTVTSILIGLVIKGNRLKSNELVVTAPGGAGKSFTKNVYEKSPSGFAKIVGKLFSHIVLLTTPTAVSVDIGFGLVIIVIGSDVMVQLLTEIATVTCWPLLNIPFRVLTPLGAPWVSPSTKNS